MSSLDQNQEEETLAGEEGAHWISVSDLMAGLMMVFLLVAVVFMVIVQKESERMREVAEIYQDLREALYEDLLEEFEEDLPGWGAELSPDLVITFQDSGALYEIGSANLRPRFAEILEEFFPRYVGVITSEEYREDIEEVRIEGHTSSEWTNAVSENDAYINNMRLSQARTRSSLEYVINLPEVNAEEDWLKRNLTANGLSSSQPILNPDGSENSELSRRVEFRVRTDADSRIRAILEEQRRPLQEAEEP
ncbi:OmpA family protein [Marinospirillum sp.]|uniref:OmpA/MotB family protein n=1 Tax=Marinospirillum sp. TaxID=2183934 RepID=UPI0028709A08|nr:OmpA family protein [Marinospirillum sp.]MDR9467743.1 OmpA family protein [Marinospirillum sp.]